MLTSELTQRIKSAGFYPIPVERGASRDESTDLVFSGSLEEFFEAAKALGATVMFFFVSKLGEEDFNYDVDCDYNDGGEHLDEEVLSSDESAGGAESFDLTVAWPSLADFRKHLGEECQFLLIAKSQLAALSFSLSEAWWNSFEEQQQKAIEKVDEDREAIRKKMEAQRLKKEESVLAKTRSLLDDSVFCRISTQRGMRAYALEKFPELEGVDDSRLTQEIQKLSDKTKTRKRR
ncbi:MAG: hypothetical protein Q8N04_13220 [Nitrospira sp.]|nr:hypothetical protein [Nitrospira sp.]